MARPAGQKLEAIDAERTDGIPRSIWRSAIEQVRLELLDELRANCSTPYPPASKNGQYPHLRTGEFVDGLNVVYSEDSGALNVYSKTHDRHGVFLQNGLRDGTTRPFGTKIMAARDWSARINKVAKSMYRRAKNG